MFTRYVKEWPLPTLLLVRYICLFLIIIIASHLIPFSHTFTYTGIPGAQNLPHWLGIWANFDGEHYIRIAREGYHGVDHAFFPLYPLLIKTLHINPFIAGFAASQGFFIAGVFLLYKLLKNVYKVKNSLFFITLFLAYPTAFFYSAVYTEGFFLFLTVGAIYCYYYKRPLGGTLTAGLSSLTRLQGIFLFLPLFFSQYSMKKTLRDNLKTSVKKNLIVFSPFIGIILYMTYLYLSTGDPFYFLTAQPSFGAGRSTSLILLPQVYVRYIKIFFTADWSFQYFVACIEFALFNFAFILSLLHFYRSYKKNNEKELGIALFSLAHLILPTLTGTLSSMPRYALFAWSPYFILSQARSGVKAITLIGFIILQVVLLSFFSQGYFVG